MRSWITSALYILIGSLAIYGFVGFVMEKPWKPRPLVVEGEPSRARTYTVREEPASDSIFGNFVQKGLSFFRKETTPEKRDALARSMETYLISSAALFPSSKEIPTAIYLAREGNKKTLEAAIGNMRKGRESLARLTPPLPLAKIHSETLVLVDEEIRQLEELHALPLPNHTLFNAYLTSKSRLMLRQKSDALARELKDVVAAYSLTLPPSILR